MRSDKQISASQQNGLLGGNPGNPRTRGRNWKRTQEIKMRARRLGENAMERVVATYIQIAFDPMTLDRDRLHALDSLSAKFGFPDVHTIEDVDRIFDLEKVFRIRDDLVPPPTWSDTPPEDILALRGETPDIPAAEVIPETNREKDAVPEEDGPVDEVDQ